MILRPIWRCVVVITLAAVIGFLLLPHVLISSNHNAISIGNHVFSETDHRMKHKLGDSLAFTPDRQKLPKILIVLGTRPEAVKCAPLISELRADHYRSRFQVLVLGTGQHRQILHQTLAAFQQTIDIDLDLMVHNQQLPDLFARVFSKVSEQIIRIQPRLLIIQGDTTTALASALAAAHHQISVAHVEAGLRSFNLSNPYPEELNRKSIDAFAQLMFAPTTFAREALLREGACQSDVFVTGNTGVDAFYTHYNRTYRTTESPLLTAINAFKKNSTNRFNSTVILVTMHRRENFAYFLDMCRAVATIATMHVEDVLIIFPVHPNPNVKEVVLKSLGALKNVKLVDPISYDIFGHVLFQSDIVMTDSGGIQEEAASIGKPVILMRMTTERPEGVYLGSIKQIGILYDDIVQAVNSELINVESKDRRIPMNLFGDGTASKQIATVIDRFLSGSHVSDATCGTRARQDSIARSVYTYVNISHPNVYSHAIRRQMMENLTRVRPPLTLGELRRIPSRYNSSFNGHESFSLTAIIGLYKREGLIGRWIEALISQTHPPQQVWITYFASPISKKLQLEIEEVRLLYGNGSGHCDQWCTQTKCNMNNTSIGNGSDCMTKCLALCKKLPSILFVGMGEMQLKYFGRFQLAIQSRTKYVVVFDDDCIPQSQYFETAMHTINTEQYRGILGTKGVPAVENYFYGPVSRSNQIIEADLVGGSWFMESEWVKLMFHDKMHSWNSGEDFHLCANARKYANIRSFVMPVDAKEILTHSFASDYMAISMRGDTTGRVEGTASSRVHIRQQLWVRGDRLMHSYRSSKPSLLLFAETQSDAMLLITHSKQYMRDVDGLIHFVTSNTVKTDLEVEKLKPVVQSFHDFMIGRDYNTDPTPITTAAEVLYAFDMVMQGTQSTMVMVMGSSSTAAMFAVVSAAFLREIPVINMYVEGSVADKRKADAIMQMTAFTIRPSVNRTLDNFQTKQLRDLFLHLYR